MTFMRRLAEIARDASSITRADIEMLYAAEDDFKRARRRLNEKRKKVGRALTGDTKQFERHARGVVSESLRCLVVSASIDPAQLPAASHAQCRSNIETAAAMLLSYREVYEAGGVTLAYVQRRDAAMGN